MAIIQADLCQVGTRVKKRNILLEQSFTTCMPLPEATQRTSAFRFRRVYSVMLLWTRDGKPEIQPEQRLMKGDTTSKHANISSFAEHNVNAHCTTFTKLKKERVARSQVVTVLDSGTEGQMGWFGVVRGHSRSTAMSPFDRAHTTSYSTLIETMRLSCTVFEI